MRQHSHFIYSIIFSLLPFLAPAQESDFPQLRDSLCGVIDTAKGEGKLSAYIELRDLYDYLPADEPTVREMLSVSDAYDAEAKRQGTAKDRAYNMINTLVYLRNGGQWQQIYDRTPAILDFLRETEQWDVYYGVQEVLLDAYLYNNKIETTIRLARKLYDESVALGQDTGAGIALCTIGRAYREQRRYEEATRQFEAGLALLEKQEKITPTLLQNYWTYCGLFIEDKDYGKALDGTRRFDKALRRFEQQAGRQVPSYQAVVFRLYAHAHAGLKEADLAEANLHKADSLGADLIGQTNSAMIRSEISLARQDYTLALDQINEAQRLHLPKRDNIEVGLLRSKADLLARLNRPAESAAAAEAAFLLADTLSNRSFNDQVEELRTQYEVDTYIAAKQRQRTYFLFTLGVCLLLSLTLGVYIRYNRAILRKNRGLYLQIKEQDRLADELLALRKRYETLADTPPAATEGDVKPAPTPAQQELADRLRAYLLADRRFASPDIDRDELFAALATNRTTLSEAVKAVTGRKLMEYVRTVQLGEAKRLIEQSPSLTIEAISTECGFNSIRTFNRQFRDYYNITPTDYRRAAQEPA